VKVNNPALLLIDDDENLRRVVRYNLEKNGYEVTDRPDGASGLEAFSSGRFDVVVTDINMPGLSGMEVLEKVKGTRPECEVILITAYATVESAVEAMKKGAFDYVTKPFDRSELLIVVERALKLRKLEKENRELRERLSEQRRFSNIIGASPQMREILTMAEKVAASDASVLILGESGTGKEMLAQGIHFNSERRDGPLVVLNCAAIPENLIESELFGHRKGAFTGAIADKVGKFEAANGGTIFLDEVGELKLELQAKLLRVLQERVVEAIGENRPRPVDVRVISATNLDIQKAVKEKHFRQDLYYRLGVITLSLPPLAERQDDVLLLANHFLEKYAKGKTVRLADETVNILMQYRWPGNVRELENVIERATILSEGPEILPSDLPASLREVPEGTFGGLNLEIPPTGIDIETLEKNLVAYALRLHGGNQTRAAKFLHMTRPTLIYRMEKYGLKGEDGP